jgi:hypothetical protein
LLRAPVRAHAREFAYDQALDPRARGFVVFLVGPVISDFRIRQDDNLPLVVWIGENFLVSSDGSIKNDFAVAFAFGAVAFASEDSAVFQRKDSLHSRSGEWILRILAGKPARAKSVSWKSAKNFFSTKNLAIRRNSEGMGAAED